MNLSMPRRIAADQCRNISMFDDRLEIESPGRFPNIVTADNISYTRFSRNKTISRVMTEFEWVRELNEGVKKIYSDMADAGLPEPEYIETPNTVKLILRNNIDVRKNKTSNKTSSEFLFDGLSEDENSLLLVIERTSGATQVFYAKETGFSLSKVQRMMKKMQNEKIIWRNGSKKRGIWEIKRN